MTRRSTIDIDEERQGLPRAGRPRARWLARLRFPAALALGLLVAGGLPPGAVQAPRGSGLSGGWIAVRDEQKQVFVKPSAEASRELVQWAARRPRLDKRTLTAKAEQRVAAPAGGVRLRLDERFYGQLVARAKSDGKLEFGCEILPAGTALRSGVPAGATSQEAHHD